MSMEYRDQINTNYQDQINDIIADLPPYVKDFAEYMSGGKRVLSTQAAYIQDIKDFLVFEKEMLIKMLYDTPISKFPIEIINSLTPKDMSDYRRHLQSVRMNNPASVKRKLSSLSALFRYLEGNKYIDKNPMTSVELPSISEKSHIVHIDKEESAELLKGILANDRCLNEFYKVQSNEFSTLRAICNYYNVSYGNAEEWAKTQKKHLMDGVSNEIGLPIETAYRVEDIQFDQWFAREPLVLRNYAIIFLFLGAGLRISELVGLNVSDFNAKLNCVTVIVKGGTEKRVYFHESATQAIKAYLEGIDIIEALAYLDKYPDGKELASFCYKHANSPVFMKAIEEEYKERDEAVRQDLYMTICGMRRTGRGNLVNPKERCDALFLSSRGTRMSVRSVELMVKDMVRTYLPDYDDKDDFHVHSLRASCAFRILSETNNIAFASQQLNHKGTNVTSQFYARMTEDATRAEIAKIPVV